MSWNRNPAIGTRSSYFLAKARPHKTRDDVWRGRHLRPVSVDSGDITGIRVLDSHRHKPAIGEVQVASGRVAFGPLRKQMPRRNVAVGYMLDS